MIAIAYQLYSKSKTPYHVKIKFPDGRVKVLKRFATRELAMEYAKRFNKPIEEYSEFTMKIDLKG